MLEAPYASDIDAFDINAFDIHASGINVSITGRLLSAAADVQVA